MRIVVPQLSPGRSAAGSHLTEAVHRRGHEAVQVPLCSVGTRLAPRLELLDADGNVLHADAVAPVPLHHHTARIDTAGVLSWLRLARALGWASLADCDTQALLRDKLVSVMLAQVDGHIDLSAPSSAAGRRIVVAGPPDGPGLPCLPCTGEQATDDVLATFSRPPGFPAPPFIVKLPESCLADGVAAAAAGDDGPARHQGVLAQSRVRPGRSWRAACLDGTPLWATVSSWTANGDGFTHSGTEGVPLDGHHPAVDASVAAARALLDRFGYRWCAAEVLADDDGRHWWIDVDDAPSPRPGGPAAADALVAALEREVLSRRPAEIRLDTPAALPPVLRPGPRRRPHRPVVGVFWPDYTGSTTAMGTPRLVRAALERAGAQVRPVDPVSTVVTARGAFDRYGSLDSLDALAPGSSRWCRTRLLVELVLARGGCTLLNDPLAVQRCADKAWLVATLAAAGVPVPATSAGNAWPLDNLEGAVGHLGLQGDLVYKSLRGSQGRGVALARDTSAVDLVGDTSTVLCQQLVAPGRTLRVAVVGGRAVPVGWELAADGEFRTNDTWGGTTSPCESHDPRSESGAEVARAAVAAAGLGYACVDLAFDGDLPVVLDVNANGGHLDDTVADAVASALVDQGR